VKELGRFTFIDKVKVRLWIQYWAEVVEFRSRQRPHPDNYIRQYERCSRGHLAQVEMFFSTTRNKARIPLDRETYTDPTGVV